MAPRADPPPDILEEKKTSGGMKEVSKARELEPQELRRICNPSELGFQTTEDLEPLEGILGQPRVEAALQFGIGMKPEGYNIFAFGPTGTGKHKLIKDVLQAGSATLPTPPDLCYINNFEDSRKPLLLSLPAGKGAELRDDMASLVEELGTALRSAFEGDDYQNQRQLLEEEFKERQEKAITQIGEEAKDAGLALLRTPVGIVFAPRGEKDVITPEEFEKLEPRHRAELEQKIEDFQSRLQKIFRQFPRWQRAVRKKTRELNREVSRLAVGPLIEELQEKYADLEEILRYLDEVQKDALEYAPSLAVGVEKDVQSVIKALTEAQDNERSFLHRYRVNVLVDHSSTEGAPVVYEDNPSYPNLVGRIEHFQQMGALVTDFNLIKPGALHRANGGYLLLDVLKLLRQPYSWEGLKRALQAGQIKTESLGQAMSLISTFSLEPEPVELSTKVVLLGPPMIYYLLAAHDPDFATLFKVPADFSERMDHNEENLRLYAQLIARSVQDEELRPFDSGAVARIIEHGSRSLGDSEKISLYTGKLVDFLREADHWASKSDAKLVDASHVQTAIDARIHRSDRIRERMQEEIVRGTVLVDTEGEVVGQVNGLSVLQLGDFSFGKPSRITARVRLGKGELIDIEREVELSGPIHAKGVLILAGFLGARYVAEQPLSLSASLVFEQSYGGVEGDSASSAELYALLSAISGVPISQSLAVTGSVNQRGKVQPIGGVNQKIEGFFDLCQARGLTGNQGVLIPASNVKHLMLRKDVVDAVTRGEFHVYPVEEIDQGIELLTGTEAGERDEEGRYPEGTINFLVEERLAHFAQRSREFASGGTAKSEEPTNGIESGEEDNEKSS
jgi:lon-related putative ATP-dependent protease